MIQILKSNGDNKLGEIFRKSHEIYVKKYAKNKKTKYVKRYSMKNLCDSILQYFYELREE